MRSVEDLADEEEVVVVVLLDLGRHLGKSFSISASSSIKVSERQLLDLLLEIG